MKRLFSLITLAALAVAPSAAQSQSSAKSTSMVGVGPHGYDWLIGTWNCTNSTPSAISGPPTSAFTASRSAGGSLMIRSTGTGFDSTGYVTYAAKTKTWWGPEAYADGSTELESTKDTGNKATWTGTYTGAASGKTMTVRDMYTLLSPTKQLDVGQSQSGGTWKTLYTVTCTKS